MVKKALAIAGAGAVLLSMAAPVLGYGVNIFNSAYVNNGVHTKADSGDNGIGGMWISGGTIKTGAATATTRLYNDVNSSVIGCCGLMGTNIFNGAYVGNRVHTKADSGDNGIGGMCVGGGSITTGAAGATSAIENIVNFSMVGMPLE